MVRREFLRRDGPEQILHGRDKMVKSRTRQVETNIGVVPLGILLESVEELEGLLWEICCVRVNKRLLR